jgi:class 3 adenylate cyclase
MVPPLLPLAFLNSARGEILWFLLVTCVVYPIPLLCVLKICSVFLQRRMPALSDPTRMVPIVLNILVSALAVATLLIQLVTLAAGPDYFRNLPGRAYAAFFASVVWNAVSLGRLIAARNRRDPAYKEYLHYRDKAKGRVKGIQRRMGYTILPFVLAIIVIPSLVVMRDFCRTTFASAISDGKALAERTANVVRASAPGIDPVSDYLVMEARRNRSSALPFQAVSYVDRDSRTGLFEVAASTDRTRVGRKVQPRGSTTSATSYRLIGKRDDFEFTSPVSVSGTLAGYVSVEVDRDVIYEPYFRAKVKVLLIAAVSLYAAIFLAYLFGRSIVFPILSLCMSVSEISGALSDMIKGRSRVADGLLKYNDRVRTQDELKMLSNEVGAMTRVIRGVIPYISGATLGQAEREKPKTERRNLAFLFTDVRGFTTFCEGQSPDTVVDILNRYLDLQTGIILANGGDIDKFVGDEIMAVFKGPGKELAACRAGEQIRTAMTMEKKLADLSGRHVISIGIGIHSGPVVFGSIGARDRMDFTSIGDTVNLAARLEGANKSYGTRALISEVVHEKVKKAFLCREIDLLTVKGKRQPVRIFELLEPREKASDRTHEIQRVFEEGLALYRQQVWAGAEKCFSFLKEKFQDEASDVFLRRIEVFKAAPPPPRWDGVFILSVK